MQMTDEQSIKKIKEGQIDYFEQIVKKYTKPIYSYLSKKIFDKSEIEDLVQNTFISFYKSINRFDEKRPILPYLFEIAKNEAKMYFRSHKKAVSLNENIQINDERLILFESEDPETILEFLSTEQKKALQLLYEGYSYDEIARKLGRPLNTTKTIIRRARLKLFKILKK